MKRFFSQPTGWHVTAAAVMLIPFAVLRAQDDNQPPVVAEVTATDASGSGSDSMGDAVGAYNQPEWVKRRRFSTTRVHIQRDPWEMALEHWWRGRYNDGEWKHRFQEEFEIGLPGRIQLDLYEDWVVEDGDASHHDIAFEIRYGLADWGVIPMNPALYLEYKWVDPEHGGDVIEPKLLLGDNFGDWQYGLNLFYERENGGENTEEWQITQGLSTAIMDDLFSLGVEAKYVHETTETSRGNPEHKVQVGPSIQFRPSDNMHLDLVALAGLTDESPDLEAWLVFGWDFGGGSGGSKVRAPVSGRR